jgi:hypothetical protein
MKKTISLLILTLGLILYTKAQSFNIEWLDGTWKGTGYQVDDQRWSVELTCNHVKNAFIISYPSLGCVGNWEPANVEACRMVFRERIESGPCDSFTMVILTKIDEYHISISYIVPGVSKEIIAFSVLKRQ